MLCNVVGNHCIKKQEGKDKILKFISEGELVGWVGGGGDRQKAAVMQVVYQ